MSFRRACLTSGQGALRPSTWALSRNRTAARTSGINLGDVLPGAADRDVEGGVFGSARDVGASLHAELARLLRIGGVEGADPGEGGSVGGQVVAYGRRSPRSLGDLS
jgi:hypothetical protein